MYLCPLATLRQKQYLYLVLKAKQPYFLCRFVFLFCLVYFACCVCVHVRACVCMFLIVVLVLHCCALFQANYKTCQADFDCQILQAMRAVNLESNFLDYLSSLNQTTNHLRNIPSHNISEVWKRN